MKKLANAVNTTPTMTSMKMTAIFAPEDIGESFWPKHTGQASATCGAASRSIVINVIRITLL
jgi:hypothetical protein